MKTTLRLLFVLFAVCAVSAASTTQIWEQRTADDFEKGEASGVSITSDGRLELAPSLDLVCDTGEVYGWGLARDSHGRIFVSGGNGGKVFVLPPGGSPAGSGTGESTAATVFFKAPEIEAHALAVDSADNVYVGTSPDGKVYKVSADGKSSIFFEPKTKYIWSLALDRQGNLWIATGDKGELFRVDRQGKGSVVYKSGDKHIRTVAALGDGVVLGTEGRGRIIRVSLEGVAFVLYDAAVREITALAVAPDGAIYASGIGTPQRGPQRGFVPAPPAPAVVSAASSSIQPALAERVMQLAGETPAASLAPGTVAQGSEIYRIAPDGYPRRIWKMDKATALSIALAPDGGVLVGTGDRGLIYKIAQDGRAWAVLVRARASQVTALMADGGSNAVYAATSNLGRVFRIGNGVAREGSFESQVKDAGAFSKWGRLRWRNSVPPGTSVKLYTRSGNTQEPDSTWSAWSEAMVQSGQQVTSPQARFFQWKAELVAPDQRSTPIVNSVEIAYLPRNVPPEINAIVIRPRDLAMERMAVLQDQQIFPQITIDSQLSTGSTTLNPITAMTRTRTTMKKGWQTVTWDTHDDNGDTLIYSVFIKGEGEAEWKLLKDRLDDAFYSWDTTNFPDGQYTVRIVASDSPSNPTDLALQTERVSERFYIDNTAPVISGLTGTVESGGRVRVRFHAADSATLLGKAEYSVDGGQLNPVFPVDSVFDAEAKDFDFVIAELTPGEHTIAVKVADRSNNQSSAKAVITAR